MERFRCARCDNILSLPVRRVPMPAPPDESLLDHHHVNPPLMEPRTYAVDEADHGTRRLGGTIVLSPGDVRGTRFVHERVSTGCWSLDGSGPSMACTGCGAMVASRTDDCYLPQDARFYPDMVVAEVCADSEPVPDPFALGADWDDGPGEHRRYRWLPQPVRPRPELAATRWRARGLKSELFRDDPPA